MPACPWNEAEWREMFDGGPPPTLPKSDEGS